MPAATWPTISDVAHHLGLTEAEVDVLARDRHWPRVDTVHGPSFGVSMVEAESAAFGGRS